MLLGKSSGSPSICLRCRIRQFHRTNGVPLRSLFAVPHSKFSTYANLRSQTSPDDTSTSQPDLRRSDLFPQREVRVRRVSRTEAPKTKMKTIRKTHRTNNQHVMLEDTSPLDTMSLGKRAEVIILRDVNVHVDRKGETSHEEAAAAEAKEREETREAIEASIATQSAVAGQEEVNAAINELKPSGGKVRRIFSAENLKDLRKALNGFLKLQLQRFAMIAEDERRLKALKRIDARINANANDEEASSRELPKSIWQEGITDIGQRLPKGTLYLDPERMKKTELIDCIIKHIWHVTTVEEMDAVGEMEVEVKPWHLELVTKGFGTTTRESTLDRIGIQRDVKIEVYKPDNIIRFTANRTDATRAINDLQLELGNVGSIELSLEPFKPMLERQGHQSILNVMNQRDVEAVANLTNTNIEVMDDSLIIRATSGKDVATARRYLISMLYLGARKDTKLFTDATDNGFLYKNLFDNALPYRHRQTNLGRWGYPINRSTANRGDEKDTATTARDAHFQAAEEGASSSVAGKVTSYLQSPLFEKGAEDANATSPEEPMQQSFWGPRITTQISAAYGNVLHSFDSEPGVSPMSAETIVESKSPVFLNSIPGANPFVGGIASLGKQLQPGIYGRGPDVLMFRFVPYPWHFEDAAAASEDIPQFSLRLSLNEQGRVHFSGAGLTLADRNAYVLMPDRVTDVGFNRREMLWSASIYRSRRVREFVQQTQESIEMRGNIRVPPSITLSIPAWTIRNIERYPNLSKVNTDLGEERVVTFSHVGTEHRQSLKLDFDNARFRGSITSVEAGRLGGRRTDVRLRVRKSPETPTQLQKVLGDFVGNGLRVAEWLDNAVNLRLDESPFEVSRVATQFSEVRRPSAGPFAFVSIWKSNDEGQGEESSEVKDSSPMSNTKEDEPISTRETGNEEKKASDEANDADVASEERKDSGRDEAEDADFAPWEAEEKETANLEADSVYSQATTRQPEQNDESSSVQTQESGNESSSDPESADAAQTEGEGALQPGASDSTSTGKEDEDQRPEDQSWA